MDTDSLANRFLNLLRQRGHLLLGLQTVQVNIFRPLANGRPRHINGNVSSSDDHNALWQLLPASQIDLAQKVHAGCHAGRLLSRYAQFFPALRSHGQIKSQKSL